MTRKAVILRRASPLSVILRSASPLSVILRSFAPKNLSYHVFVTGEKILRCAQNDRGERLSFGGAALPPSVILRGASPPLLSF